MGEVCVMGVPEMESSPAVDLALRAAVAASAALPRWSALGPNARREALMKAAAAVEAKGDQFVEAMMADVGATEGWARFNIQLGAGMIREAAALTTQIGGDVIPSDKPGCLSMAVRKPAGVVLGIAPWNAPIILGIRSIVVPLACGNTVILKASELSPRTHALIAECFVDAGFGDGIVTLVSHAPEEAGAVVGALIDHPAVRRVNFTGSTGVGRIIAERAARNLKPALLELGGKAPMLVLEDADLDEAVRAGAFGAFMNQGQICMSTERIIVVDAIADAFVERFAAKAKTLVAGDPRQGKAPLGAVVDLRSARKIRDLIADAVAKGAKRIVGDDGDGVLMPANVVDYVVPSMRIYAEESFGPVVSIIRAFDTEDAIRIANDTEFGLTSSVFTKDIAQGLTVARRIQAGMCHINGPTVHDEAQMPFGGMKASGYGRFGGKAGIDSFTELRWISIETQNGHFPI